MPGTILVSVLEFKGISSSSDPSAVSLKISMGKRSSQTWGTGDFSFPITKLSEDLVVTLLNGEGSEIAKTGFRTMQIIHKGSLDEVFWFEGGGHVQLKLQFALNEDERNRIRVMRESAMKRNLETSSTDNLTLSESISSTLEPEEMPMPSELNVSDSPTRLKREVSSESEATVLYASDASSVGSTSIYDKEEESTYENESTIEIEMLPSTSIHKTETESTEVHESMAMEGTESSLPLADIRSSNKQEFSVGTSAQDDSTLKLNDQGTVKKTPSNVRKMISAFESGQIQDVKSLKREAFAQPQLDTAGNEGSLVDRDETNQSSVVSLTKNEDVMSTESLRPIVKDMSTLADFVPSDNEPPRVAAEMESCVTQFDSRNVDPAELSEEEKNKSLGDLMNPSATATVTSSRRMHEEQSQEVQVQTYDSSYSSDAERDESMEEDGFKGLHIPEIQGTSDSELTSPEYFKVDTVISSRSMYVGQSQEFQAFNSSDTEGKERRKEDSFEGLHISDIQGTVDLKPTSTEYYKEETATSSGRMDEEQTQEVQASESSEFEGNESRKEVELEGLKSSDIQGKSDQKTSYYYNKETEIISERMYEKQSQEVQAYNSSDSSDTSGKESRKEAGFEGLPISHIQGTTDQKQISPDYYKEEFYPSENANVWIFPQNTKRLCITTAGNQVMKIVELQQVEANIYPENNLLSEDILKKHALHHKEISDEPKPESGSPPDDSHNRLVGQVIKVAVILGFGVLGYGVLVSFTKKNGERKKKREENGILLDERKATARQSD